MISEPQIDSGVPACVAWLRDAERERDLMRPFPELRDAALAAALRDFVDGLRGEMLDLAAIVEAATENAALNAQQLEAIVVTTAEQSAVVEQTAAAIAEIDRGAAHVATTADALRDRTSTLASSSTRYDAGVETVLEGLEALAATVDAAASFATAMESGTVGIVGFLGELRRIARQARLLAINAAIEAAHLGDVGRGFVIVGDEVKQLAASTSESARNVGAIEKQLHDASLSVEQAIRESSAIVRSICDELAAARVRSRETQSQVAELEGTIGAVAAIASQQSASLSNVAGSIERIAAGSHEISAAAERAARLALGDALTELRGTIAQYRLGHRAVSPSKGSVPGLEAFPEPVRDAAASLRARVDADQREILRLVTGIAIAIARNSYEWRAIASGLGSLRVQLEGATRAIDETAAGAISAAGASEQMRTSLGVMRRGFSSSIDELRRALERVAQVRESVSRAAASVDSTSEAARHATEILELIDTISSETALLSLNAAIEAAHAGTAGNGFGVIADEIRVLADTTSQSTHEIGTVIGSLAEASAAMSETTAEAVARTTDVHAETTRMQNTVATLRGELDRTLEHAAEVATIVEQQLAALRELRDATQLALQRVEQDSTAASDGRRIDLAMLGMRAHTLAARRPLGTIAEEIRAIGFAVAQEMDAVFDAAIDRGTLRVDDCFDTEYVELVGPGIAKLARLFDVTRVPASGFVPPKYETRYDRAIDEAFNALIDARVPTHAAIKAMFAVDLNGFCFGHYRECRQAWTGDHARDLDGNRIKRFFEDDLSLRCSRVGLGDAAHAIPPRAPYAAFRERGCTMRRDGPRPWAIFTYARDTGIVYNDLSIALYARDQRVATIRVIYDADAV